MTATSTTTEKIHSAEETVARAREALEAAESGLRTAKNVSAKADIVRSRPILIWTMVLVTLGVLGWLMNRDAPSVETS